MNAYRETHSRPVPGGRGFWWTESLWRHAEGLPVRHVQVADIREFDRNCWFGPGREPTCRAVAEHAARIRDADLAYPVILSADGGLMDGGHRLAKALLAGQERVPAVQFVRDPPPDWIDAVEAAASPDSAAVTVRHAPDGYVCPFCLYASGGENDLVSQRHIVERTDQTLTFVSPKWWPNNQGHLLVVPTRHIEAIYDLAETLAVPLQSATRRAALALKAAYGCDGTSVRQHNEPGGDQDVWHYHLHVFPRFAGDQLNQTDGALVDQDAMTTAAERLRRAYR